MIYWWLILNIIWVVIFQWFRKYWLREVRVFEFSLANDPNVAAVAWCIDLFSRGVDPRVFFLFTAFCVNLLVFPDSLILSSPDTNFSLQLKYLFILLSILQSISILALSLKQHPFWQLKLHFLVGLTPEVIHPPSKAYPTTLANPASLFLLCSASAPTKQSILASNSAGTCWDCTAVFPCECESTRLGSTNPDTAPIQPQAAPFQA